MADDSSSTTRKRRFGFGGGRQDDSDETVRNPDEWVDTLTVSPRTEGEGSEDGQESDDAGSPFDTSGLSESPDPQDALGDPRGAGYGGTNGEDAAWNRGSSDEPVPRRDWRRRSGESVEEIEFYIDRVIGTANDPRMRRRTISARELGLEPSDPGLVQTQVEGLPHDIPIKLPFPEDEMRGARLVYETEGGYVIEITRAVGGSDRRIDRQFYTVSRVGHVEQVVDQLRRVEDLSNEAASPSEAEPEPLPGAAAAAPEHAAPEGAHAAEPGASFASVAGRGAHEEPLPDDLPPAEQDEERFGGVTGREADALAERGGATEMPRPEEAGADTPHDAAQDDDVDGDAHAHDDADGAAGDHDDHEEESGGKRRGFGLFTRRRKGRADDDQDLEGQDDAEDATEGADADETAAEAHEGDETGDAGGPRRKLTKLFRRRKDRDGNEDDGEAERDDADRPRAGEDDPENEDESEDEDEPALRA